MAEPLLTILNRHAASCGDPPIEFAQPGDNRYVGYFENMFGEQWIFTFDRAAGRGQLRGGDIEWNTALAVEADGQGGLRIGTTTIILSTDEWSWLLTCWRTATRGKV
jgi:hypothetical protein